MNQPPPIYSDRSGFLQPTAAPAPKTSAAAIASFVAGILFCVPVISQAVAIICGVISLITISSSKGRLTGRGFAVTGLLLGVVSTGIWIWGMFAFARWAIDRDVKEMAAFIDASQSGDVATARMSLTASASSELADEDIFAFGKNLTNRCGELIKIEGDWDCRYCPSRIPPASLNAANPTPEWDLSEFSFKFTFENGVFYGAAWSIQDPNPNTFVDVLIESIEILTDDRVISLLPLRQSAESDY